MSRFNAKGCMDDIMALQEKMQFFEKKKEWEYACCASRSLEHMIYHYHRAREEYSKCDSYFIYKRLEANKKAENKRHFKREDSVF